MSLDIHETWQCLFVFSFLYFACVLFIFLCYHVMVNGYIIGLLNTHLFPLWWVIKIFCRALLCILARPMPWRGVCLSVSHVRVLSQRNKIATPRGEIPTGSPSVFQNTYVTFFKIKKKRVFYVFLKWHVKNVENVIRVSEWLPEAIRISLISNNCNTVGLRYYTYTCSPSEYLTVTVSVFYT